MKLMATYCPCQLGLYLRVRWCEYDGDLLLGVVLDADESDGDLLLLFVGCRSYSCQGGGKLTANYCRRVLTHCRPLPRQLYRVPGGAMLQWLSLLGRSWVAELSNNTPPPPTSHLKNKTKTK